MKANSYELYPHYCIWLREVANCFSQPLCDNENFLGPRLPQMHPSCLDEQRLHRFEGFLQRSACIVVAKEIFNLLKEIFTNYLIESLMIRWKSLSLCKLGYIFTICIFSHNRLLAPRKLNYK